MAGEKRGSSVVDWGPVLATMEEVCGATKRYRRRLAGPSPPAPPPTAGGVVFATRRAGKAELKAAHGVSLFVADVSPAGALRQLHPSFPVSAVPVPHSKRTAVSVLGVVEGLKVWEKEDVQCAIMAQDSMKGIVRKPKKAGAFLGYRLGLSKKRDPVVGEREARYKIYMQCYKHVLDTSDYVQEHLARLRKALAAGKTVVLVDNVTPSISRWDDLSGDLTHTLLLKLYLTDSWPQWTE